MNQNVKMFMESNKRMEKLMKTVEGKTKLDESEMTAIDKAQREYEGQIKHINSVIAFFGIDSKNKRTRVAMERMNLIDETTAVDLMLGDPEVDKVRCPEHNELITRAECLDHSGSHVDDCSGCEIGKATRNKLLPPVL